MFEKYIQLFKALFSKIGLGENISSIIAETISFATMILATILIYHIVLYIIRKTINTFIQKSE